MSEGPSAKLVRKGTKSCVECQLLCQHSDLAVSNLFIGRRRKIRCIWRSKDVQTCQRCEERGRACVAQLISQPSSRTNVTSQERILHLERQVATLTKTVQDIQRQMGSQIIIDSSDPGIASDSDTQSEIADTLSSNPPKHLQSLFDNDLISSENREIRERREPLTPTTLSRSRSILQELIPLKEDMSIIATFAPQWLFFLNSLFPLMTIIPSDHEMLSQYEMMKRPGVNLLSLALWLLSTAITVHQMPHHSGKCQLRGITHARDFSKAVADAVEATILRHDRVLETLEGIEIAMHYARL